MTLSLPDGIDEREAVRHATNRGIIVQPLSSFAVDSQNRDCKGLVLGYGAYNVEQIKEAATKLAAALRAAAS